MTRVKEEFLPLIPNEVSIYCCGVTVYDRCHLGHARSYIVWDILRRYLLWLGYKVTFVQNFTDIDDKILRRASELGCSMEEVSDHNINAFHEDMDALGILRPDRMPRATKSLDAIRNLIEDLQSKGIAYSIEGDVYFEVMKYAGYGKLSGRELDDQLLNADGRVAEEEKSRKKNSFDFALWKGAKPGEASFPSPWGNGRPGWHIECSAMVREELGNTIDIHLGGADLVFPHHENEIAQSEAVTGQQLAKYWLHNGMVNVGGLKMSKSLGNFTTIRDLFNRGVSAMTIRLFVLQANYRKPLDFTEEALGSASIGWRRLNSALCLGITYGIDLGWPSVKLLDEIRLKDDQAIEHQILIDLKEKFEKAMDDDLNSASALAVLFELARPLRSIFNRLERGEKKEDFAINKTLMFSRWRLLLDLANILGLRAEYSEKPLEKNPKHFDKNKIEIAISLRRKAKSNKDFTKADQIRDELREKGIELIDKPDGNTEWIYL